MNVGLYAKAVKPRTIELSAAIIGICRKLGIGCLVHENLTEDFREHNLLQDASGEFGNLQADRKGIDIVLSLGGDGTILDTIAFIGNSGVPVLGINLGRLGFLSALGEDRLESALTDLRNHKYSLDKRSLLYFESSETLFQCPYALNDFVIHKKETSSMITVHTYLNGEFMNSYWADGLIVSTPTGSTGYSLSCGGPILFPRSNDFVITPIAPHNLNARPVVVGDNHVISFEIEGRSNQYLISLDARSVTVSSTIQMAVRKADFHLNLIQLESENFLNTLRTKMNWGVDPRN